MTSNLNKDIETRKYLRSQITRLNNNIISSIESFSTLKKQQSLQKLNSIVQKIEDINSKISFQIWDESNEDNQDSFEKEMSDCESYEDKVIESRSILEESLKSESIHNENSGAQNNLKPPTAPLPKYSGEEGENLEKFFSDFKAVMNKYKYSSFEKFIILKGQISGRAAIIISSLERSKQSYEEAKDLLSKALASPLQQKYETIQKILDLKISYSKDPYVFVSEMRIINESFKNLKIDIDTVLQFCFWKAMNETLQNQFIQITNKNKPSLSDINENVFPAVERYIEVTKRFEEKKKLHTKGNPLKYVQKASESTTNYASNVVYEKSGKFKNCGLCTKSEIIADHSIYACPNFKSVKEKHDKLKEIKGCIKCGYIS